MRPTCFINRGGLVIGAFAACAAGGAFGQSTVFTYQGTLDDSGAPANGLRSRGIPRINRPNHRVPARMKPPPVQHGQRGAFHWLQHLACQIKRTAQAGRVCGRQAGQCFRANVDLVAQQRAQDKIAIGQSHTGILHALGFEGVTFLTPMRNNMQTPATRCVQNDSEL